MLPGAIEVRISSEAAGSIVITPVVVQQMTPMQLVEQALPVYGKDAERIAEAFRRGSLVSGASRLRWQPCPASAADLAPLLAAVPASEPSRPFVAANCFLAVMHSGAHQLVIPREAAAKRRLFKRRSFWDHVLTLGASAKYVHYSYREKADVYRAELDPGARAALREAAALVTFASLERQLTEVSAETVDLYTARW